MHNIQCEETMGHAIGHQDSKTIFIRKRFGKKKTRFSGLLFFLSILVYGGTHRCDDTWSNIYYKGKKTLLGLMHDIHDKIDLGHRIEHCNSTNKVKIKRCARKNRHFYGLLFFFTGHGTRPSVRKFNTLTRTTLWHIPYYFKYIRMKVFSREIKTRFWLGLNKILLY